MKSQVIVFLHYRDGLFRILVTVLGRPLSSTQHNRLMERLGLADRGIINFTDFFAVFREAQSAEYPKWMDPIQRSYTDKAVMTAVQVHAHLKDKARSRWVGLEFDNTSQGDYTMLVFNLSVASLVILDYNPDIDEETSFKHYYMIYSTHFSK